MGDRTLTSDPSFKFYIGEVGNLEFGALLAMSNDLNMVDKDHAG